MYLLTRARLGLALQICDLELILSIIMPWLISIYELDFCG